MKTQKAFTPISIHGLKSFITLLFIGAFSANASAQHILYSYDNNGNRTGHTYTTHAPIYHNGNDSTGKDSNKIIASSDTNKAIAMKYGINVYPNPTTGQVYVSISFLQTCGFAMVYLTDASGNELSAQKATSSPVYISLANYKEGEYYIRIALCGEQVNYKVIKVGR